jgi:hypothetical protein
LTSDPNRDALPARHFSELDPAEFLDLLSHQNILLEAREGRLIVNAPTGTPDDRLRAELLRRKADLLNLLNSLQRDSREPLLPAGRGGRIPMTPSQQGMWLIDHFDPGKTAYNIPEAFIFPASLDLVALQQSIDLLLARHEILRTSFHEEEGELYQAIAPEARTLVGFTDLSSLPEIEVASQCRAMVREHMGNSFDLRNAPLLRVHLFRLRPDHDLLFLNIHHIIADYQALQVLREELMVCYSAYSANVSPDLPILSIHYADYAIWAAAQLRSGINEKQIQYWKQKLAGLQPYLKLPTRRPYPAQRSASGATVAVEVPLAASESLIELGRLSGATPFMTFLAAYAVLLARFSGEHDFCIGSPVTLRTQVETERMIGLFMNMLPFRMQFEPHSSFREILQQIRTATLEAFEQRDVPFQTLVRSLRFNRRSPRSPIFQVMFSLESSASSGAGVWQVHTQPGTARYDLSLLLIQSAGAHISGTFEYRTDLFDEDEIAALSSQFGVLVQELTVSPDRPCLPARPVSVADVPESKAPTSAPSTSGPSLIGTLARVFSSRSGGKKSR